MNTKRISQTLVVSLTSELINKLAPLVILYFVLRRIGVSAFGSAQFGISLIEMTIPLVTFGYNLYGSIEISKYKNQPLAVASLMTNLCVLKSFNFLATIVAVSVMLYVVPGFKEYLPIFFTLSFMLILAVFDISWILTGTQQLSLFSILQSVAKVPSIFLIMIFVRDADDALLYAILLLLGNAIASLLANYYAMKSFHFGQIEWRKIAMIAHQAAPMGFGVIAFGILDRIDVLVSETVSGSAGVGIYSGQLRLVHSLSQIMLVMTTVFFSESLAVSDKNQRQRHLQASSFVMLSFVSLVIIGAIFVDERLGQIVLGPEFSGSMTIFTILSFSLLSTGVLQVIGWQGLYVAGKTRLINSSLYIGCAASALLGYTGGQYFGLLGVAVGSVIGKSLAAVILLIGSGQDIFIRPNIALRAIAPAILMGAGLYVVSEPGNSLWITVVQGAGIATTAHLLINLKWLLHRA